MRNLIVIYYDKKNYVNFINYVTIKLIVTFVDAKFFFAHLFQL